MKNKRAAISSDKTVVVILVIIAILAVVGFLVSLDYNFNLNLLPDFNKQQDLDEEILIQGLDDCTRNGLEFFAKAYSSGTMQDVQIYFNVDKSVKPLMYVKKSDKFSLELDKIEVGYRSNNNVVIHKEYLDEDNNLFLEDLFSEKPHGVTAKDLALLEGANWTNSGYFCKEDLSSISTNYKNGWPESEGIEILDLDTLITEESTEVKRVKTLFSSLLTLRNIFNDKTVEIKSSKKLDSITITEFVKLREGYYYYVESKSEFLIIKSSKGLGFTDREFILFYVDKNGFLWEPLGQSYSFTGFEGYEDYSKIKRGPKLADKIKTNLKLTFEGQSSKL